MRRSFAFLGLLCIILSYAYGQDGGANDQTVNSGNTARGKIIIQQCSDSGVRCPDNEDDCCNLSGCTGPANNRICV